MAFESDRSWANLDHAPPPGETLRDVLTRLEMSQRELAVRTGLTPKHVNQVLQGVASLTPEVAERLELATGVAARLWNRLEADYRTVQTRLQQKRDLNEEAAWVQGMPIKQLVARGIFPPSPRDDASRARQLLAFFGVASPKAWREYWLQPNAAFRQSKAFNTDPGAVAAWLRLGELRARAIECAEFDPDRLRALLPALRDLSQGDPGDYRDEIVRLLATVGVALVFVREVTGARVSGATLWLTPSRAAIILSGRYGTDDVLFFTLFHEIAHLLLHGRRESFVDDDTKDRSKRDPREVEADEFAAAVLLTPEQRRVLPTLTTVDQVRQFAAACGVSPGIVVGQLHHLGLWKDWRKGAKLKRHVEIDD